MKNEKINITPGVCLFNSDDNKNQIIEINIPGVKKKDIELRMQDYSYTLKASRGDVEYRLADVLCCPVNSKDAKAEYKDGLLVIKVPYKDLYEDAVKIKIA